MEFNIRLYDFLRRSECKIYKYGGKIKLGVIILHFEVKTLMDCFEPSDLGDDGLQCNLKYDYIYVDLTEVFEYNGYKIYDYRECFEENDVEHLEKEIKEFDK